MFLKQSKFLGNGNFWASSREPAKLSNTWSALILSLTSDDRSMWDLWVGLVIVLAYKWCNSASLELMLEMCYLGSWTFSLWAAPTAEPISLLKNEVAGSRSPSKSPITIVLRSTSPYSITSDWVVSYFVVSNWVLIVSIDGSYKSESSIQLTE